MTVLEKKSIFNSMPKHLKTEITRINGYLKEVVTFFDSSGKPISRIVNPLMVELKPRDILQIFVGAFLIAAPLCFTEEVWQLSISLKKNNVYALGLISLTTVTLFIYLNFYRYKLKGHFLNFLKRVLATYVITISSIILILILIDKFPFEENPGIAIKRVIIIGFPSTFGAVISDYLK
ncbi:MAG: hypothetical protein CL678_04945 [Bdellovibrionaceae bacterium]|nr:hypothetical protein [Pseudobdellovibrionaceae bacterium]|tara:strand:- start:439 stop:972 length:534 start_codon:yes stop_codon:yes gene_type:complete